MRIERPLSTTALTTTALPTTALLTTPLSGNRANV